MKLNPKQDEAVKYVAGPCLVLAGAGSGKTRVITNKIAYLVEECGYQARHIAAVTFTNKASKEMKERVAETMGKKQSRGLWVSTFHTLGLNIIRKECNKLGLKSNFSLFDDVDSTALIKELTEKEFDGDKDLISALMNQISNWKNDLMMPNQAQKMAQSDREKQFAALYERYMRHMRAYNALDFDDLILMPTLLLATNQEVRERWQQKIRYLLVDEYQDTNTSQYQLVKYLVGERARFTVVGDDDQSIYSWRGAKPQNLVLLGKDFPNLKLIKLEQNYRSSGRILNSANILIDNNPHVYEKSLFSELAYGEPLKVISAQNEDREAERVVAEIIRHKFMNNTNFGDYAILYRGNHQARVFEKTLMTNRIPYKMTGGTAFFSRAEVKDIMAYLRLLANPEDDNALLRIINLPKRGIGPATMEKIGNLSQELGCSMFEAACDERVRHVLGASAYSHVEAFTKMMVMCDDEIKRSEPIEAIRTLLGQLQYENYLYETSPSPKAAEMRMKNVNQLYSWLTGMLKGEDGQDPLTVEEAVAKLSLRDMLERNSEEEEADQVQLLTLHSSKGLEYPYVFMVGMEEGLLPHQTSVDEGNVEEERRLAYVGITRAQRELWFTMSRERRQYGETVKPEPSRFLAELPQDDLQWEGAPKKESAEARQKKGKANIAQLRALLDK